MPARKIRCSKCGHEFLVGDEVENDALQEWTCPAHSDNKITIEVIDFIKERIHVARTEYENQGRMVLRELVQNADDARSVILVLRFEPDALYVANDGRAFSTQSDQAGKPSDFERIRRILKPHKAEEEDATGHFGTGFQTVYTFTNAPEIHSGGWSLRMNPVHSEVEKLDVGDAAHLVSPYVWRPVGEPRGALFKFPWRNDVTASEEDGQGHRPFENPDDFPRWNLSERVSLFAELASYAQHVLLCCNNLRTIRLVWADEGGPRAVQVRRIDSPEKPSEGRLVRTMSVGDLDVSDSWMSWDSRHDPDAAVAWRSFQPNKFKWQAPPRAFPYLVRQGVVVDDDGHPLHIGVHRESHEVTIVSRLEDLRNKSVVKKNDVWLLLPLFDATESGEGQGRAFLYSVIPLPKRGENWFAFSGRFFPEQSRLDVAVRTFRGQAGKWHESIVVSVGRLYVEAFPEFVRQVTTDPNLSLETKQKILLNAVPGCELYRWMRAKEEDPSWAADQWDRIVDTVTAAPILLNGESWVQPKEAYWAREGQSGIDEKGRQVLQLLGDSYFTDQFVDHPNFERTLAPVLTSQLLTPEITTDLVRTFLEKSGESIKYATRSAHPGGLDKGKIQTLVDFCILSKGATVGARSLPIVPGSDRIFRSLSSYPIIPSRFEKLRGLLPASRIIHPDFEEVLLAADSKERTLGPDDVAALISELAHDRSDWAADLPNKDVETISQLIEKLLTDPNFNLKDAHAELSFIPYRWRGKTRLGTPNAVATGKGGKRIFLFQTERREGYQRDFIYAPFKERPEWLTAVLESSIRFIELQGVEEATRLAIFRKLSLVRLQEGRIPTNFVRQFLSKQYGSLFIDSNLRSFLQVSSPDELEKQKRAFLIALRAYFRPREKSRLGHQEDLMAPEEMGAIPCLYDSSGTWAPPSDFALGMRPELKVLTYKELHRDLADWPPQTLLELGVVEHPEARRIVETVRRLSLEPKANRKNLANIFAYLVTVPRDWKNELDELRDVEWIPVKGGGMCLPADVIAPTQDNFEIVGKDHPSLFDIKLCLGDFFTYLSKGVGERASPEKYRRLGVSSSPGLSLLTRYVGILSERKVRPPPRLFAAIAELLPEAFKELDGQFWFEDRWYAGSHVLRLDDPALQDALGDEYLVIDPRRVHRESRYLDAIGSNTSADASILAFAIDNLSKTQAGRKPRVEALGLMWNRLEEVLVRGGGPAASTPSSSQISYPIEASLVPVSQVILPDEGDGPSLFREEGWYGDWYVFVNTARCHHPRALRLLGALTSDRLSVGVVRRLLVSISAKSESLNEMRQQSVLQIFELVHDSDPKVQFGSSPVWPAVRGGEVRLVQLSDLYLPDHPIWSQFASELWFLSDSLNGKGVTLRELALAQAQPVRLLSQFLRKEVVPPRRTFEDRYVADRLRLLARAVSFSLTGSWEDIPPALDWLSSVAPYRADGLRTRFSVGDVSKTVDVPCEVVVGESKSKIYLLTAHPDLIRSLSEAIFIESEERGLSKVLAKAGGSEFAQKPTIIRRIENLLGSNPADWGRFVAGLPPITDFLPSLMPEGVEAKPGYPETRQTLLELYQGCQICGRKTPSSDSGDDTCETVRSVISRRGGRYYGDFDRYEIGNSLFLCPSHHALFERKLVRFPDVEPAVKDGRPVPQHADKAIRTLQSYIDDWQVDEWEIEVFEGQRETGSELKWWSRKMQLKGNHARRLLSRLAKWLELRPDD